MNDSLLQLITKTATNLPSDVRKVLKQASRTEKPQTQAGQALRIIHVNVDMAKEKASPYLRTFGTSVTMDSKGDGLQADLERSSGGNLKGMMA